MYFPWKVLDHLHISVCPARSWPTATHGSPAGMTIHPSEPWKKSGLGTVWKHDNTALVYPETNSKAGWCWKDCEERRWEEGWELGPKPCEKLINSLFQFPTWNRWCGEDFEMSSQDNPFTIVVAEIFQIFTADVSQERNKRKDTAQEMHSIR